ncbi:predicted protein [Naegleria gruberi]|uniref:Predicted protein n=1 Tax=Naegleria gruberi TaxID=5762 RepID=D2VQE2_NAEGR|nr:uncharacterized protein NAEGRDRAFT_71193 [Naegleria gruberi]EFC40858.1 predicted protein [Naegleria gruberi]|eukprot:XP_002673602.1 predicted protein [Naegleria gruberi strain NEG-M]
MASPRMFNLEKVSKYAGKPGSIRSNAMNYGVDNTAFTHSDIPERALEKKLETIEIKLRNRENRKPEWNCSTFTKEASEERALLRTLSKDYYKADKEKKERDANKPPSNWNTSTYFTKKETNEHDEKKLSKSLRNTKKVISEVNAPSLIEREKLKKEQEMKDREEATRITMREHFLNSPPVTLGLAKRLYGDKGKESTVTYVVKDLA